MHSAFRAATDRNTLSLMKRRTKIALVVALLAGAITLWIRSRQVIWDAGAGSTGYVYYTNGKPIEGVTVTIRYDRPVADTVMNVVQTESVKTGFSGEYQLMNFSCNRPGPTFTLIAEKDGMITSRWRGEGVTSHDIVLHFDESRPVFEAGGEIAAPKYLGPYPTLPGTPARYRWPARMEIVIDETGRAETVRNEDRDETNAPIVEFVQLHGEFQPGLRNGKAVRTRSHLKLDIPSMHEPPARNH